MMADLDSRLHAFRPDLADVKLQGRVDAKKFVEGVVMEVITPVAALHRDASITAMQTTQALLGERLMAFEVADDWVWGQLTRDGYVGYISRAAVSTDLSNPTHRASVPSTFLYPLPDIKSQPSLSLPMNARFEVVEGGEKFSKLKNGRFVYTKHIRSLNEAESDFVGVAEKFLDVPYYWGGKTSQGLDCSGLVQTALEACGVFSPRDTDMQETQLGQSLLINDLDGLRRGDLVFWKGHVGIMADQKTLLHANGHHMMTVKEPLSEAVARIAGTYGQVTSIRRF
ncbi:MAG TPA: NlpC/P60 family protein [Aestuariivirga sp.]|nr:NlpC/P60 family protein [Aestuariivirga sp.]